MSTHNISFHDKIRKLAKLSLNIYFHEVLEEFPWDTKTSLVFESLKFYYK